MQWLKRNLVLVIGGLVTLGLLGGAGYYLFTKLNDEKASQELLDQKQQQLQGLLGKKPFPNKESIEAVKADQVRVKALLDQFRQQFVPVPVAAAGNSGKFKEQLENVLYQLQHEAQKAEVKLPTNFNFSFTALRPLMQFETNSLKELSAQLADIRTISSFLFDSKVYDLWGIRRTAVSTHDQSAAESPIPSADYLARRLTTNTWGVTYPYEFSVRCTSAELASALDRLARVPHGFIVKSVRVEPAEIATAEGDASMASAPTESVAARPSMDPRMATRYGLSGGRMDPRLAARYGRPTQPTAPTVTTPTTTVSANKGPGIIVEPKPLRITLLIDVVRPKDEP